MGWEAEKCRWKTVTQVNVTVTDPLNEEGGAGPGTDPGTGFDSMITGGLKWAATISMYGYCHCAGTEPGSLRCQLTMESPVMGDSGATGGGPGRAMKSMVFESNRLADGECPRWDIPSQTMTERECDGLEINPPIHIYGYCHIMGHPLPDNIESDCKPREGDVFTLWQQVLCWLNDQEDNAAALMELCMDDIKKDIRAQVCHLMRQFARGEGTGQYPGDTPRSCRENAVAQATMGSGADRKWKQKLRDNPDPEIEALITSLDNFDSGNLKMVQKWSPSMPPTPTQKLISDIASAISPARIRG